MMSWLWRSHETKLEEEDWMNRATRVRGVDRPLGLAAGLPRPRSGRRFLINWVSLTRMPSPFTLLCFLTGQLEGFGLFQL